VLLLLDFFAVVFAAFFVAFFIDGFSLNINFAIDTIAG
jgi:hypothetical protein